VSGQVLVAWGVAATVDGWAGASRVKGSLRRFAPLTRSFPAWFGGYRGDAPVCCPAEPLRSCRER
jgi:hypothetical protein